MFRVLHICTGNICRSPLAERLTRAGLATRVGPGAPFTVESAGTWGQNGSPMDPDALAALPAYGIDGSDFRARELTAEQVAAADLILGATREHRAAAVVLQPRASARTFTLREFARLAAYVDPADLPAGDLGERARALVRAAAAQRGRTAPVRPVDDDLDDPYRGPRSGFAECAALVHDALQVPLDRLAPVRP